MCKVSIIMPSLNVGMYIEEAVKSVLNQTMNDIEVLCIDAGSTDCTLEILESIAACDSRVRLLHSDTKSYGYQMNIGMDEARGEYIGIVETDDYVDPDMFENLYELALKNDADIVKSDFDLFTEGQNGIRYFIPYSLHSMNNVEYGKCYSCDDYINETVKPECYIWNAIYRKEFLSDICTRFNESPGASYQDFSFRYQTVYFAKRIFVTNIGGYHYRRDNTGASTYNPRGDEYNLRESVYTLELLKERGVTDRRIYKALANEIIAFAFWPHMDLVKWGNPADSEYETFIGYRNLIENMMKEGYLMRELMAPELWLYINLLLEGVDVYLGYVRVAGRFGREDVMNYIGRVLGENDIVIFGSGIRGNAAYVTLVNNGAVNIRAFCDNDVSKQGTGLYGTRIMSPEEAVAEYKGALFILPSPGSYVQMKDQLVRLGVDEERIERYALTTNPFFCTNCMLREIRQMDEDE